MSPIRRVLFSATALGVLVTVLAPQAAPRPQPYCIRGVALDRSGEHRATLLLRDGAITAVLDAAAPAPPGTRVIEGEGLICLPAFLDAYSRQGCTVPQPVKDQDIPPNELADVGVDMRLANRKGLQPDFRAVEGLTVGRDSEAWRKSGFGAMLVAPGGELLSGISALVTTRDAAARDLVLQAESFEHAAFAASGPGYPSTLMGYFAQLRQFFMDSQRQSLLEERFEQGRPGSRPPYDAQLEFGAQVVSGERRLLCEAQDSNDIERWFRIGDEFGFHPDLVGGLEAWRVQDLLAERRATIVLTLDWGKEVKDPRPKKDSSEEAVAKEEGSPQEGKPAEATAVATETWEYQEPLSVRIDRRLKWEQGRDCAVQLAKAGVRFVFGTASSKPSELLDHVRILVENGLGADAAQEALTRNAADFLGVGQRLGRIAPGFDASFALWRSDPLTDKKATVAWAFVDGFPYSFKEEAKRPKGEGPGEDVDPTGTWELVFNDRGDGVKKATLVIHMERDGSVSGTLEVENPMGGGRLKSEMEGEVSGKGITLRCTLAMGEFKVDVKLTATIDADRLEGEGTFSGSFSDEPVNDSFSAIRTPS